MRETRRFAHGSDESENPALAGLADQLTDEDNAS